MSRALFLALCVPAIACGQTAQYLRTLEELSEPAATRWQHFAPPYFSTNEKLLNRFYPRFENAGGVTVGVSFQQNLSLLVHARPKLCVIFDYNPGLTEILVPFMGELMVESPTRRDFVSTLLGASLTANETRQLLQGEVPVATILTAVLERTPVDVRKQRLERLRARLRTPRTGKAANWIEMLENEELLTGVFFEDAIAPYRTPSNAAGWLSTEQNYALVRSYWMSGKIVGITGDISGSSIAKLGAYLRARHLQVTTLYLSNVGLSVEGHFPITWFRDLYATLETLPVTPGAMTLVAHGPWRLTAFVRSLKQAEWVYRTLADVPEETVIRLHEAPLEMLVQRGSAQVFPALRQGLAAVGAPPVYLDLLRAVEADAVRVRRMRPAEFTQWAKGIDVRSPIFRTIMVTLLEAELISPPGDS